MAKRKNKVPVATGEKSPDTHINFVYKHAKTFCHSTIEVDRKAKSKRSSRKLKYKHSIYDK